MNQNIYCPKCAVNTRERLGLHQANYPNFKSRHKGEYIKLTWGTALNPYRCDLCGQAIPLNTKCAAFSIWTDRNPFIPGWEERYINPLPPEAVTIAEQVEKRLRGRP